ncbi:MAG: bacterial transcriptional activator domain-containing protein, partial [Cyanobacteria bacterium REEB65]|nr:bacterial transcriptional activator domain-containing protein [Cyanobacteria bacterium REEB65]
LGHYRGRYLADLPAAPWIVSTQEHFHSRALSAFEEVCAYHLDTGDPETALHWADRALTLDTCAETLHQAKMRALVRLGNRKGAMRQYEQLVEILEKELGVPPDRSSQELLKDLKGM